MSMRRDVSRINFKKVHLFEEVKIEDEVKILTDKEKFNEFKKKAEEFLLKPIVTDYLIYLETLIQVFILVFSIFTSWLFTKIGLSVAYIALNIFVSSIIYGFIGKILIKKISMKMKVEAQKENMDTNPESIEWLNFMLQRIWGTIEPVATEMVPDIVDTILKDFCPPFIHSLKLTKFNLGSEAPRLESVTCFKKLEPEEMQMIWHVTFIPVTQEENNTDPNKRITEIQATAYVGKEKFLVPLNVNVSNLFFEGKILARIRFSHSFPFVKTVSVCFMEPPTVSCSLKPLCNIDMMGIPGVQQLTNLVIKTVLPEIAMNPTTLDLDIETMLKSTAHDDPTGILKINLMEGRGLRNIEKIGTSDPYLKMLLGGNEIARTRVIDNDLNPFWNETKYLIIPLNVIRDSFVGSDTITFEVYDKNKVVDKLMGRTNTLKLAEYAQLIEELEEEKKYNEENGIIEEDTEEPENTEEKSEKKVEKKTEEEDKKTESETKPAETQEVKTNTLNRKKKKKLSPEDRERIIKEWGDPRISEVLELPLKLEGRDMGSLHLQMSYHAVKKQTTENEAEKAKENEKEQESEKDKDTDKKATNPEQADQEKEKEKEKDINKVIENEYQSGILRVYLHAMKDLEKKKGSKYNPYAIVEVNHEKIIETQPKKKTNNPVFSSFEEIFVKNINTASLNLTVKDNKGFAIDPVIGSLRFKIKPIMKYLIENPTNDWLELDNSPKGKVRFGFDWFPVKMNESNDQRPAIGMCRIDLIGAKNIKNVEKIGKSDPYIKLNISGKEVATTRIIDNNLDPEWNETYYTLVRSRTDRIKMEMFDFNNINVDRKLGSVEYFIKDICDNLTNDTEKTEDYKKMRVKPTIKKLNDGRFDILSPLYEKQERNMNTQGELHFQLQYYAITQPNTSTEKTTEVKLDENGKEIKSKVTEMSNEKNMTARGFSMFSASQMGISSFDLQNNKNNITGILRIKIEEAKNLRAGCYFYTEFSFDNSPDEIFYRSSVLKSTEPVWDEITEGLIMNIINNNLLVNIRIRVKESGPTDNDTSILSLKFGLNDISPNLNKSLWYTDSPNDPNAPAIKLALGYSPIDVVVPPKDYLPNMGVLTINVDNGKVIPVDSSGTSDPYIIFSLNGNKVYETQEIKKTIEPCWNEKFDVDIRSRRSADLELKLMDWNKVEKHTVIGVGILSLVGLVPNQNLVVPVEILSKENKKVGIINLILNFSPSFISKSKQDKERKSQVAPVKVINNVAQGGFSVVKGVFKAPGSVVSTVASGLKTIKGGNKNKVTELKDNTPSVTKMSSQQQQISTADIDISQYQMKEPESVEEPQNNKELPSSQISSNFQSNENSSTNDSKVLPPISDVETETTNSQLDVPKSNMDTISENEKSSAKSDIVDSDNENQSRTRSRTLSAAAPNEMYGTLYIHVIEAKDLKAVDSTGTSDPYVKVMRGTKLFGKTKVIKKNLYPVWNEIFKVNIGEVINNPLTIQLKDHNTIQSSKSLGDVQIMNHNSIDVNTSSEIDEWYPVENGTGSIHIKLEYNANEIDSKSKKSSKKK